MFRKIAVVTGSRADHSPMSSVIKDLGKHAHVIKTSGLYGHETSLLSLFRYHKPDLVFLIGDRHETLTAAACAVHLGLVVCHSHGGDFTPYCVDEQYRNAISKLAYYHFPACQLHADRLIKMGEKLDKIFICGAPGVDNLVKPVFNREECENELGIKLEPPVALVCYHPETLGETNMEWTERLRDYSTVIISGSNEDIGGDAINSYWEKNHTCYYYKKTFSSKLWLSLMREADVLIGNSSGFIFEGMTLGKNVIMIGNRQTGRYEDALAMFKNDWSNMYPFGKPGEVGKKIADILLNVEIPDKPRK